jgi:diguanylate cyclase (GGDEF)-like protein
LTGELGGIQRALLTLGTSPSLTSDDLSGFYEQAREVLKTLNVDNIVLIDPTFRQRMNTIRPFGSELPSKPDPLAPRVFATGKPMTTDIFPGPVTKKATIAVSVPVFRGDAIIYDLAAGISPERLSGLLTQEHLAEGWIGTILDSTGTIVARTHQAERFVGAKGVPALIARTADVAEGSLETTTLEGIPVVSVFSKSAVSNWTVALGIPIKDLTAELVFTLWWLVLGTTILLFSTFTVAWVIGTRIAAAIDGLVVPALALGYGESVIVPSLPLREADEVGRALTKASEMLMSAQTRANHDALTGLANRALFSEILSQQLAICNRDSANLTIVFIDLDGFKLVNDVHGHAIGDEVLCTVAQRLKNAIREADLAVRLGGDEFALILIHASLNEARVVAQKLVDSLSVPYRIGSIDLEMSASIGIAGYPESGTTSEALLRHADEAMYKAKAAGKRGYAVAS